MKLSFSTRGWPGLTWEEMLETALDMGFSGVEVYNLPKFDPLLEKGGPFHKYQSAATVRQLREKKLEIPCFDTSCDLSTDLDLFRGIIFPTHIYSILFSPFTSSSTFITISNYISFY